MFPENPDPIGDMQCIFSVKSSIPFLVESKRFPVNFSEQIFFTEETVGDYISIPASMQSDFEYSIFLKRMNVSEIGSQIVFKISSDEYPEMEIFRDLIKIPSVVIDYKYVEAGFHKTMFTFHHNHLLDVSRFLFKARRTLGNGVAEYLGPNRGFDFVLQKALKADKVVAGIISLEAPENESEEIGRLFACPWTRRLRYSNGLSSDDFIYRIDEAHKCDRNIFNAISGEEGIYWATIASKISIFHSRLLYEYYNPMFYQSHEYNGETLRIFGAVSESYARTMVNIVSDAASQFPQLGIKLVYVAPVALGIVETKTKPVQ